MSNDIYFGLGIRGKNFGLYERGRSEDVIGIVGLWADIDIAGPTHKKENLPATIEEAMELVSDIPIPPTLTTMTGGGLHLFWLFREPWMFENAEERIRAATFVEQWMKGLQLRAKLKNWSIDSTHDLARVFRVAGTRNLKYGSMAEPVLVKIVQYDTTKRSDPSEFDPYLIDLGPDGPSPSVDPSTVDAVFEGLDAAKERFDFQRMYNLFQIDPKIEKTWQRKRKDMKDSTPSAYDLALTNYMIQAGWSDQDMVDALMICRAEHREDKKFDRPDYYAFTIAKAKATQLGNPIILATKQEIEAGLPIEDPLGKLNSLFQFQPDVIQMTGWYEQSGKDTTYLITTTRGNVAGVPVAAIQDPKALNRYFIAQRRVAIPITPKFTSDWNSIIVQIIMKAIRDENGWGEETTILGSIKQWLTDYLMNHPPAVSISEATRQRTPFIFKGRIYISPLHMRPWLNKAFDEDATHQTLLVHLREYGAKQVQLNVEVLHGRSNRTVWELPENEWTTDVVKGTLFEHFEKYNELPRSALAPGASVEKPSHANGSAAYDENDEGFGIINLTPKITGWEGVESLENDGPTDAGSV